MSGKVDVNKELSANAMKVLEKRYLKKDAKGLMVETPEELFWRVAKNIAKADSYYGKNETDVKKTEEKFFNMMARLTPRAAPPEMPMVYGSTSGFLKSPCRITPAKLNAPPIANPKMIRGRRIPKRIL